MSYCNICGQNHEGTACPMHYDRDVSIYDEGMNVIANLKSQLAVKEAELSQAREKITSLLSLVDGAKSIVEIYKAHSPAQSRWKSDWLNKAREALK
jgi:hypothetical protein